MVTFERLRPRLTYRSELIALALGGGLEKGRRLLGGRAMLALSCIAMWDSKTAAVTIGSSERFFCVSMTNAPVKAESKLDWNICENEHVRIQLRCLPLSIGC